MARRDDSYIQGVPKNAAYPPQDAAPRMPAISHHMGSPIPTVSTRPSMKPSAPDSKVPRTLRFSVPFILEPNRRSRHSPSGRSGFNDYSPAADEVKRNRS